MVDKAKLPLTEEAALCVALAARELPNCEVGDLLQVLINLMGAPITKAKLAKVRVNRLRQAAEALDIFGKDGVEQASLQRAVSYLKGKGVEYHQPAPVVVPYREGDMPDSIRVACSSNSAERIDGHFGSCARFLIYQVSPSQVRLIDARAVGKPGADEDKNAYRAELIADCALLYTSSIGGPAAAKVVKAGVFPIKLPNAGLALEEMSKLRAVLVAPPPWLAKAMGMEIADALHLHGDIDTTDDVDAEDQLEGLTEKKLEGSG
jgi:nitrogen fixation protein NifX